LIGEGRIRGDGLVENQVHDHVLPESRPLA
jgi:hypothetical protein